MKTLKLTIIASIFFLCNFAFSQSTYFSSKQVVPLYAPFHSGVDDDQTQRRVYFDLSEVNNTNGRLDVVGGVSEYQLRSPIEKYYDVDGSLYLNSNDSNFNDQSSTFTSQHLIVPVASSGSYNAIKDMLFAQLRSSGKKDVVVLRDSNICVYRNSSGNINIKLDSVNIINVLNLAIGNFNNLDELEDVIVFHNDTIKIFKSNNDGTLDRSYFPVIHFSGNVAKIISKQLSLENQPFRTVNNHNGGSDRDEIIFSSGSNIYIYLNSSNNSFTYSQTVSLPYSYIDFEIADLNDDGWNDLVSVGQNNELSPSSFFMKVYLNNGGGTISSNAIFTITSNIISNCKITIGDFNKDGWNDIVMGGRDTIRVFENIKGSNLFSTSNIVNYKYSTPTIVSPKKIMVADLTNQGGLSVLFSGHTQTLYESDPQWLYENILRFNPSEQNTNPAPPYLFKDLVLVGQHYRPRLLLFSRGDRDFQKYIIYKKSPNFNNGNWFLLDSSNTSGEYIDYDEGLNVGSGGDPIGNCFYYAKAQDNSYHVSVNSNTIDFSSIVCPGCGWEAEGRTPVINISDSEVPKNYTITNYPNPFNPVTNIIYEIPKEGNVKIIIYNSLGQLIAELVNEFRTAGIYKAEFNGSNFGSGIYYYRIDTEGFSETKKMILVK